MRRLVAFALAALGAVSATACEKTTNNYTTNINAPVKCSTIYIAGQAYGLRTDAVEGSTVTIGGVEYRVGPDCTATTTTTTSTPVAASP